MTRILTTLVSRWWAIVAVLALWQIFVIVLAVNPFLIPGPIAVFAEIVSDPLQTVLPMLATLRTAGIGLALGVTAGYAAAVLAWSLPLLNATITPVALLVRSIPFVALVPVITRVLGYSELTAWIICAIVSFFPTFVMVGSGLRAVPAHGADLFRVNGARRTDRFRYLAAPSSFVLLTASLKIAGTSAIAASLIAEYLMGIDGLASVFSQALDSLDMTLVWAASFTAVIASVIVYLLTDRLESVVRDRMT